MTEFVEDYEKQYFKEDKNDSAGQTDRSNERTGAGVQTGIMNPR